MLAMNARDEALQEIAKQMRISNGMELLRRLYNQDAITEKEYVEKLKKLLDAT